MSCVKCKSTSLGPLSHTCVLNVSLGVLLTICSRLGWRPWRCHNEVLCRTWHPFWGKGRVGMAFWGFNQAGHDRVRWREESLCDATPIGGWGCGRFNYTLAFALQPRKIAENLHQRSLKVLGKIHWWIWCLFTGSLDWPPELLTLN